MRVHIGPPPGGTERCVGANSGAPGVSPGAVFVSSLWEDCPQWRELRVSCGKETPGPAPAVPCAPRLSFAPPVPGFSPPVCSVDGGMLTLVPVP